MDRGAIAIWSGTGTNAGTLTTDSGALLNTPFSLGARFELEASPTSTTPEELLAAAYAACFTMDLAERLAASGHPPFSLRTEARVQVVRPSGYWEIPAIRLHCAANVPSISDEEFLALVQTARSHGPIARTLRADLVVTVSRESVPERGWDVPGPPA
jgi:osmotically inducible protein OsmC